MRSIDKKGNEVKYNLEGPINQSVFPGHQGGPHNHTITALATALKQAASPEFADYQKQVLSNSQAFATSMSSLGYSLVSGGTENHLMLVDLKPSGIDGARVEAVLEMASIAINKNTVPGDKSALIPGGIRVGTPALTSRGFEEAHFESVAEYIHRGVQIAKVRQSVSPSDRQPISQSANQPISTSANQYVRKCRRVHTPRRPDSYGQSISKYALALALAPTLALTLTQPCT